MTSKRSNTKLTNYESKIKQLNTTINKQKADQKRASLDAQINKALDNVSATKHTATTTPSVQACSLVVLAVDNLAFNSSKREEIADNSLVALSKLALLSV